MKNFQEYVNMISESAPSWIRKMPLADLKSYAQDHPSAGKITLDYINREITTRSYNPPPWLTKNKEVHSHYAMKDTGEKIPDYRDYYVSKKGGEEIQVAKKDGKSVPVEPVHMLKGNEKKLSHYEDKEGNKYDEKDVSKEKQGEKFVYDRGEDKDKEVLSVKKTVPEIEINKDQKNAILKELGLKALAAGTEVIDKSKLTKAPYSKGTVFAFGKDGKLIARFTGSDVQTYNVSNIRGERYNRPDIIANADKFVYVPNASGDWNKSNNPEQLSRQTLQAGQKDDDLSQKDSYISKKYYSSKKPNTPAERKEKAKEYYNDILTKYKTSKRSTDLEPKVNAKIEETKKQIKDLIDKHIETLSNDNVGRLLYGTSNSSEIPGMSELTSKLKMLHGINKFHKMTPEEKEKEGYQSRFDAAVAKHL